MNPWNFETTYTNLPHVFYSPISPQKVQNPKTILFNTDLAHALGVSAIDPISDVEFLSGNKLWGGSTPIAQAYMGHQFGHLNLLGDGRALLLGEHLDPNGVRFDVQLKGSGRTPYSRGGDGRAALGPMLREYLMSEALFHLGIPTTRSLAVIATGELVHREQSLPGAILIRIAKSHIRVGTFQFAAHLANKEEAKKLIDYAIWRHDPELTHTTNPYLEFLKRVLERQARLIAQWMSVGFIHGVMNTDNMTISGETLDYGPCAFLDEFDPTKSFSSIDRYERYSFKNQPSIAQWNLARFAETLLPFLSPDSNKALELAQIELQSFELICENFWQELVNKKLGFVSDLGEDVEMKSQLLSIMERNQLDWTNTFLNLTNQLDGQNANPNKDQTENSELNNWINRWKSRIKTENKIEIAYALMRASNPLIIPRNRIVEEILSSATLNNDLKPFEDFLKHLKSPFTKSCDTAKYQDPGFGFSKNYKTYCGT